MEYYVPVNKKKTLGAATAYVILNHKSEQKKPDMHTV